MSPAIQMLARRHTVYMPTTPGFNGTPEHPAVGSMADLADLAAKFARNVIGGPCDVVAEVVRRLDRRCGWRCATPTSSASSCCRRRRGFAPKAPAASPPIRPSGCASSTRCPSARRRRRGPLRCWRRTSASCDRYTGGITPRHGACRRRCPASRRARSSCSAPSTRSCPIDTARRLTAGIPQVAPHLHLGRRPRSGVGPARQGGAPDRRLPGARRGVRGTASGIGIRPSGSDTFQRRSEVVY